MTVTLTMTESKRAGDRRRRFYRNGCGYREGTEQLLDLKKDAENIFCIFFCEK